MGIFWGTQMRFESILSQNMAMELSKSGCRMLFFGLESGSEKILNDMQKGIDLSRSMDILKFTHEAGILNHVGIIVGFPSETLDDHKQTIKLLLENQNNIDFVDISEFILKRHAPIMNNLVKFGIEFHPKEKNDFFYYYDFDDYNIRNGLGPEHIQELTQTAKQIIDSKFTLNSLRNILPTEHLLFLLASLGSVQNLHVFVDTMTACKNSLKEYFLEKSHHSMRLERQKGIYVQTFDYDLQEVLTSINGIPHNIFPHKSTFILNTKKGSIISASELWKDFLSLCDGHNTLEMVIDDTMKKWPQLNFNDCIALSIDAISKDILIVSKE
jgi:hypothetical protein